MTEPTRAEMQAVVMKVLGEEQLKKLATVTKEVIEAIELLTRRLDNISDELIQEGYEKYHANKT